LQVSPEKNGRTLGSLKILGFFRKCLHLKHMKQTTVRVIPCPLSPFQEDLTAEEKRLPKSWHGNFGMGRIHSAFDTRTT
jgi:hypothetical protein